MQYIFIYCIYISVYTGKERETIAYDCDLGDLDSCKKTVCEKSGC